MAPRGIGIVVALTAVLLQTPSARAEPPRVNTIRDIFTRLNSCWRPPPAWRANPDADITVIVSFRRDGQILGRPKVTLESDEATDNDRLQYRVAVMQALQRCTPMPFTDSMGNAVAGRPLVVRFHHRKRSPQPLEKRAWLTTTTL